VTDGLTDGQTDGIAIASTALAMRALQHAVKINNGVLCCFDSWVLSTSIMLRVFV